MLTGTIRAQIDQIWNAFWSGGVSNPLSVIEQLTFLLFIKRLDELHMNEENKSEMLGIAMERRIFPDGSDAKGEFYDNLRWSRFKNFEARERCGSSTNTFSRSCASLAKKAHLTAIT